MEENLASLKQHINQLDMELYNLRKKLASIELSIGIKDTKQANAAEKWLELVKTARGKWSGESLSSVEIVKAGRACFVA